MRFLVACLLGFFSASNAYDVYYPSIETSETCIKERMLPGPPFHSTLMKIERLAWLANGPVFLTLPSVNFVDSTGEIQQICMDCDSPPCFNTNGEMRFECAADKTYWSIFFRNLIVRPGDRLTLQTGDPEPPTEVALMYQPYYPPPSPSSTAMPMQAPLCACASCAKNQTIVYAAAPACPNATGVQSNEGDRSTNVVMAVFLGIFTASFIILGVMHYENRRKKQPYVCPYCEYKTLDMKSHLIECEGHLLHFTPIHVDQVTIVDSR